MYSTYEKSGVNPFFRPTCSSGTVLDSFLGSVKNSGWVLGPHSFQLVDPDAGPFTIQFVILMLWYFMYILLEDLEGFEQVCLECCDLNIFVNEGFDFLD